MSLNRQTWGTHGPPVLLVHGLVANGAATWAQQRPLAERWTLIVLDRRGYAPNPPVSEEDFDLCAEDVAEALIDVGPAHLVGHSYGGIIALLAAAHASEYVRSLVLIEPPVFGAAVDDPDVKAFVSELRALLTGGPSDPDGFLRAFLSLTGFSFRQPSPLPDEHLQHARLLQVMRPPEEAIVPFAELRRAGFPSLVVSGGHSAAFDRVSDIVAAELGGTRHAFPGAGHAAQRVGAPFNDLLEDFWAHGSTGF